MTYRDMMRECGGNLSWCMPKMSEDGKDWIILNGHIFHAYIDGKEYLEGENMDAATEAMLSEIAEERHFNECWCCECPDFEECECMDDSDKDLEVYEDD